MNHTPLFLFEVSVVGSCIHLAYFSLNACLEEKKTLLAVTNRTDRAYRLYRILVLYVENDLRKSVKCSLVSMSRITGTNRLIGFKKVH